MRCTHQSLPRCAKPGDMTAIVTQVLSGTVEPPDILVGGTPCQAFSVAGSRDSLSDTRQLSLEFVRLANAIDTCNAESSRNHQPSLFGKMCRGFYRPTTMPSDVSWPQLLGLQSQSSRQGGDGRVRVWCMDQSAKRHGASLMLNFSDCPSVASASSLSRRRPPPIRGTF